MRCPHTAVSQVELILKELFASLDNASTNARKARMRYA